MTFKPMLATDYEADKVVYPVLASPKVDGIRAPVIDGRFMSRSMKPIPNKVIQGFANECWMHLNCLDGELTVGPPNAQDTMQRTSSGVMSIRGEPEYTFWVFDCIPSFSATTLETFENRLQEARDMVAQFQEENPERAHRVQVLEHVLCSNANDLVVYEAKCINEGYEGIMIRAPNGVYKQGRSTVREGGLLKVKRFKDAEALVVGAEEMENNLNTATVNELGHTKRSTHQAGKVGAGVLGNFILRGVGGDWDGVRFTCGSGLTAAQRARYWKESQIGKIVSYKYFSVGSKDAPRFPIFKGFRNPTDLDIETAKLFQDAAMSVLSMAPVAETAEPDDEPF